MRPVLILAAIAGGASGIFTFLLLGAGEVATPSPGSIFALMAVAPKGGLFPVLAGITVATAVSFVVAMPFVKKFAAQDEKNDKLKDAKASLDSLKSAGKITQIVFACDAGMGSSAMGANKITKLLKNEMVDVKVEHCSVEDIPTGAQIIICHKDLMDRVKQTGTKALCFGVSNLVNAPEYVEIVEKVAASHK